MNRDSEDEFPDLKYVFDFCTTIFRFKYFGTELGMWNELTNGSIIWWKHNMTNDLPKMTAYVVFPWWVRDWRTGDGKAS